MAGKALSFDLTQKTSNNPGLSDKAWKEMHKKLVKYNMKYMNEIQENRMRGMKKSG